MARGSILRESEREYLWSEDCYVDPEKVGSTRRAERKFEGSERHARSRIKNEVTANFREVIRQFRKDLHAVETYNNSRVEGGYYEFEQHTLRASRDELVKLRERLDRLIERADRGVFDEEAADLWDCLSTLWADLPLYKKVKEGDIEVRADVIEQERTESGLEVVGPPEYLDQKSEVEDRKGALIAVLRKSALVDILEYLAEHGSTTLPKQPDGEESWRGLATRYFVNELGLATKDDTWSNRVEYELTDRGEAVHRAWAELKQSDTVTDFTEQVGTPQERREGVHYLLRRHFDSEDWSDVLESSES